MTVLRNPRALRSALLANNLLILGLLSYGAAAAALALERSADASFLVATGFIIAAIANRGIELAATDRRLLRRVRLTFYALFALVFYGCALGLLLRFGATAGAATAQPVLAGAGWAVWAYAAAQTLRTIADLLRPWRRDEAQE